MSPSPFDLIIVGAGPAGSTAALYARRHGLRILLLDRATFPRDKTCGDAISGQAMAILRELGLLSDVAALPGGSVGHVVLGSPDNTQARIELPPIEIPQGDGDTAAVSGGFVIRRQILDALLCAEAREAADEYLEGFAVQELLFEDGAACGVRGHWTPPGSHATEEGEFRGRMILGCDGFNSIVARTTGLYHHDSRHGLVALRCYYENVDGLDGQIELHFVREASPGYFWMFPLEEGRANIGIGMLHAAVKKQGVNLRDALARVIARPPFAERFALARPLEKPVGWNLPVGSKRRPCSGDGFLLLGDAAGLIDPFTGEGISNAMYSARVAAEVAAEAVAAGDFSARFLMRYSRRLWEGLRSDLRTSARMQRIARFQPVTNFVIRRAARDPELRALITEMIRDPGCRKKLTDPLFYLRLLLGRGATPRTKA